MTTPRRPSSTTSKSPSSISCSSSTHLLAPPPPASSRHHQGRSRSNTLTSVASFARRRPQSAVSIVLLAVLGVSLLLAAVGLGMLVWVVNNGLGFRGFWTGGRHVEVSHTELDTEYDHPVSAVSWLTPSTRRHRGHEHTAWPLLFSNAFEDATGAFNGGDSTVFVIKTSRIHASRPAAFGPHILEPDGRAVWLAPIEEVLLGTSGVERTDEEAEMARRACPRGGEKGKEDGEWRNGTLDTPEAGWVALVERGGCPFAEKVRYVQWLGAKGVIVGDWKTDGVDEGNGRVGKYLDGWGEEEELDIQYEDPALDGMISDFNSGLITMYAPGDTWDIKIPSVFVAREAYSSLRRDWEEVGAVAGHGHEDGDGQVEDKKKEREEVKVLRLIMSRDEIWTWPFLDVLIILLFLPSILTFLTLLLHRVALFRRRRADRAPKECVDGLPSVIWRKDMEKGIPVMVPVIEEPREENTEVVTEDEHPTSWWHRFFRRHTGNHSETSPLLGSSSHSPTLRKPNKERRVLAQRECALCLSDFEVGERVRVLPCGHCFHQEGSEECMGVDIWLLRQKRLCPVCRTSILQSTPPTPASAPADLPSTSTSTSTSTSHPTGTAPDPIPVLDLSHEGPSADPHEGDEAPGSELE